MKILVFSDSHGAAENVLRAAGRERPELCFFLGDGESDLSVLYGQFPALSVYAVRGNCDLRSSLPRELRCSVGGVGIFAAHGDRFNVKYDADLTELRRASGGADAVLFGHTHTPLLRRDPGVLLLNPGAIGCGRRPSYALITAENGELRAEILYLPRTE